MNRRSLAVVLTAITVLSVLTGPVLLSEVSSAVPSTTRGDDAATPGQFDTRNGEGTILPGATVFQGESDVRFAGGLNPVLIGVSGNAEGQILDAPIPHDQTLGRYTNDGTSAAPGVVVNRPRVTRLEVPNRNDADVAGKTISRTDATNLNVVAVSNFEVAEDLELVIQNGNGLDVTNEVLSSTSPNRFQSETDNVLSADSDNNAAMWNVDLTRDDRAGTYRIVVQGSDDLTFGEARRFVNVGVERAVDPELRPASTTVTRGTNLAYTIAGGTAGDTHVVTIGAGDFRDDLTPEQATRVFRNVGDTIETGIVLTDGRVIRRGDSVSGVSANQLRFAYARVHLETASGTSGAIATEYLDTGSFELSLYPAGVGLGALGRPIDQRTVTLDRPSIRLDSPRDAYVIGSRVDVVGVASPGIREIALYARERGDWQVIDLNGPGGGTRFTVSVASDGRFIERDVALSRGDAEGNELLSFVGTYQIAAIDAADARVDGTIARRLTTAQFNRGTNSIRSARIAESALSASFVTVNNQVTTDDGFVDVSGFAPGSTEVGVVVIDQRGNTAYETVRVRDDGTFSESVSLSGLVTGPVTGHVFTEGRDGVLGSGSFPGVSGSDFGALERFVATFNTGGSRSSLSGDQARQTIRRYTVDDTASDDLMVTVGFRLTEASTRIDRVHTATIPADGINPVVQGDTMVVSGTTNLRSGENTIVVEVMEPDGAIASVTSTRQWAADGRWSVEIDTAGLVIGRYTVEADDGRNRPSATVEIRGDEPLPSPTPAITLTPTITEPSPEPTPQAPTTTEPPTTVVEPGQPGFGLGLAVVAVVLGAVLLALWRR